MLNYGEKSYICDSSCQFQPCSIISDKIRYPSNPLYYLPKSTIFASMFVCRFVCVCVCLSVCKIRDTGHSFHRIITKLGGHIVLGPVTMCIVLLRSRSNNQVTGSKTRSIFKIPISPLILQLQQRNKYWHVACIQGYPTVPLEFRFHANFCHQSKLKIFIICNFRPINAKLWRKIIHL